MNSNNSENRIRENGGVPDNGQFSSGVELLSRSLKTVFLILVCIIVVMILLFLTLGGSFIVDSTKESVIVLRFGQYYNQYDEGWHWFLPYPVNQIVRVTKSKQELRSKSFMPSNSKRLYDPKAREEGSSASLMPGIDGYLLTGEAVEEEMKKYKSSADEKSMIHTEWVMSYRISDPSTFYLNCMSRETMDDSEELTAAHVSEDVSISGANAILLNLLNDTVITVTAGLDIRKTYYEKAPYENMVKQALIRRISEMNLGITLENLSLVLVSPPIDTIESFQMLQLAMPQAAKDEEEARTYSVRMQNEAVSESAEIVANAESYKRRVVSEVKADASYFRQILTEYRKNPESTLVSLYSNNLASAMTAVQEKFVIGITPGSKQELRLKLNPEPKANKADEAGSGDGKEGK